MADTPTERLIARLSFPAGISEAEARHVRACVRACANIPTEALEAGVVGELREACEMMYMELGLSAIARGKPALLDQRPCMVAARAAIAKAKPNG